MPLQAGKHIFAQAKAQNGTSPSSGAAPPASPGAAATAAQPEGRVVTKAELAQHASETDIWMVIDGGVYDVTGYDHPGGEGRSVRLWL